MADIQVEIVTPQKAMFSESAASVTLPGIVGDIGVLPGHLPLVTFLKPGQVSVEATGGVRHFAVGPGYAEVLPHGVRVLVDSCEGADEIDIENARQRVADLEKIIDEHGMKSMEELAEEAEALAKERARIAVAERATK